MNQITKSIGDDLPSREEIQKTLPFSKWVVGVLEDAQVSAWDAFRNETIFEALTDWYMYNTNLDVFLKAEYPILVSFTGHFQNHIYIEKEHHAILTEFIKDVSERFTVKSIFYKKDGEDTFEIVIDYGIQCDLPTTKVKESDVECNHSCDCTDCQWRCLKCYSEILARLKD